MADFKAAGPSNPWGNDKSNFYYDCGGLEQFLEYSEELEKKLGLENDEKTTTSETQFKYLETQNQIDQCFEKYKSMREFYEFNMNMDKFGDMISMPEIENKLRVLRELITFCGTVVEHRSYLMQVIMTPNSGNTALIKASNQKDFFEVLSTMVGEINSGFPLEMIQNSKAINGVKQEEWNTIFAKFDRTTEGFETLIHTVMDIQSRCETLVTQLSSS
mmetsp:Transcript_16677/g.18754  ORF Transcript_16677/g.18754 Transcript_16677/m.18754 type:complete len:217 (-) Transcript_16677:130-780(-)